MPVERAFLDGEAVRMVVAVAVIVVEIDADLMRMVAVVGMGMSEAHGRACPGDQHAGRQETSHQSPGPSPDHLGRCPRDYRSFARKPDCLSRKVTRQAGLKKPRHPEDMPALSTDTAAWIDASLAQASHTRRAN